MGVFAKNGWSAETVPLWVNQLAAGQSGSPYAQEPVDDDLSFGDFMPWEIAGNLGGGIKNLAKGLGSLAMLGLGDIRSAGADVLEEITPMEDTDRDYFTDDIAKGLVFDPEHSDRPGLAGVWEDMFPALRDDWERRYAEPFEEEGVGGVLSSVLSDPLPALLDVVSAAQVGGRAASMASTGLHKAAKVADAPFLDDLARIGELKKAESIARAEYKVSEAAQLRADYLALEEQLTGPARFINKVHPGRGMPEVAVGYDTKKGQMVTERVPVGGVRPVMSAASGKIGLGYKKLSSNPVNRGLGKLLWDSPLRTAPIERHLKKIGADKETMRAILEGEEGINAAQPFQAAGKENVAQAVRTSQALRVKGGVISPQERLVAKAYQYGMDRIEHRPFLEHRARRAFDKIAGRYTTTFYGARDEYIQAFVDVIDDYRKRGVPVDDIVTWGQADTFARRGVMRPDGQMGVITFQDLLDSFVDQTKRGDPEFNPQVLDALSESQREAVSQALPDNYTFNNEKMRLELSSWSEAPQLLERLAGALGGTVEILDSPNVGEGLFRGIVARINHPNGSFKVQALTHEGAAVADAVDDVVSGLEGAERLVTQTQQQLDQVEADLTEKIRLANMPEEDFREFRLEQLRNEGISLPDQKTLQKDLKQLFKDRHRLRMTLREARAERKGIEVLSEDLGEYAMYDQMRHFGYVQPGDVDFEAADLIAKLRVMRHNMTIAPARKRGQFPSVAAMMERAYLPVKLELFANRSGNLRPVLAEAQAALESGDAAATEAALQKLRNMGFTPDEHWERDAAQMGWNNEAEALIGTAAWWLYGESGTPPASHFETLARLLEGTETGKFDPQNIDHQVAYFKRLGYEGDSPNEVLANILADSIKNQRSHEWVLGDLEAVSNVQMWEHFSDLYRQSGKQTPIYIPHIDARRAKAQDWLMQKFNVGFENKASTGWAKKALGHVYVNGNYVTDAGEAYSRRAAQVQKYMDMLDLHNELIDTFGRPVSYLDEIGEGEALMAPRITEHYFRMRAQAEEEVIRLLDRGDPEDTAILSGAQKAFKKMDDLPREHMPIEDYIRSIDPDGTLAHLDEEGRPLYYAVPKVVAKRLDAMAKYHLGWKARIFWDGPLNVWRAAVLAFSPRWLVYNLLGNIAFATLQGANVAKAFRLMGEKTGRHFARKMGIADWTPKFLARVEAAISDLGEDAQRMIHGGFFSSTEQGLRHLGMAEGTEWGKLVKHLQTRKVVKGGASWSAKMRRLNESIEESFRQTSFIKAMDRQLAEGGDNVKFLDLMDKARVKKVGMQFARSEKKLAHLAEVGLPDESMIKAAVDEVNYFFNDYMTLGPIERNVIKRYIMPFYSFYKHQARLISTYAIGYPVAAQVLRQSGLVGRELAEEFGNMPDWMIGSLPIGPGGNPGDTRFWNTRSANPFSGMLEGLGGLLTGLAPQVRGVMEAATGRDIVTGRPFSSPETVTPFGAQQGYSYDPESGQILPTEASVNPLEIAAQQFPQFELGRDIATGVGSWLSGDGFETGARYSTGEVIVDPLGNPVFPTSVGQKVGGYFGVSTRDFNQLDYAEKESEMERAALIGLLRRSGVLPMPVEHE